MEPGGNQTSNPGPAPNPNPPPYRAQPTLRDRPQGHTSNAR